MNHPGFVFVDRSCANANKAGSAEIAVPDATEKDSRETSIDCSAVEGPTFITTPPAGP
jgi:hypothetical protein